MCSGVTVQQCGEEGRVDRAEPDLVTVELSFEDGDLVSEGKYLDVLGTVAHWQ